MEMIVVEGKEIFTTLEELVDPKHTALVIIDMQNDYIRPEGALGQHGVDMSMLKVLPNRIRPVLEAARDSGTMVVHVQMIRLPHRLSDSPGWLRFQVKRHGLDPQKLYLHVVAGTWGCEIVDELKPKPEEIVVTKHRSSTFVGTNLDMLLRSNGIKTVVIVGCVTEGCVESTARDAQFFDYYTVVLRDCVATSRKDLHDAALLVMNQRMDVFDSEELLRVWSKQPVAAR